MNTVRIATYNVLSSHLAEPDHFKHCDPRDLAPAIRFERMQEKIAAEMRHNAIICLQEISQLWAGPLHAFFQQQHYHFVTALYGGPRNGYMGVGLAWPTAVYEAAQVDIKRLADSRSWPSPSTPNPFVRAALKTTTRLTRFWHQGLRRLGFATDEPFDPWDAAQRRSNELILARLRHRQDQTAFCVATYHMPCLYGSAKRRQTMMIHASLAAQYVQQLAADDPYVLAGDFNFVPGSSAYRLLTEGSWDRVHEDFPTPPADDDTSWDANSVQPLQSAYAVKNGEEPDFTNNARVGDEPLFIETLDYIFLSPHWSVEDALALGHRSDIEGPFPNAQEPSDHVLLRADLNYDPPDHDTINKIIPA